MLPIRNESLVYLTLRFNWHLFSRLVLLTALGSRLILSLLLLLLLLCSLGPLLSSLGPLRCSLALGFLVLFLVVILLVGLGDSSVSILGCLHLLLVSFVVHY